MVKVQLEEDFLFQEASRLFDKDTAAARIDLLPSSPTGMVQKDHASFVSDAACSKTVVYPSSVWEKVRGARAAPLVSVSGQDSTTPSVPLSIQTQDIKEDLTLQNTQWISAEAPSIETGFLEGRVSAGVGKECSRCCRLSKRSLSLAGTTCHTCTQKKCLQQKLSGDQQLPSCVPKVGDNDFSEPSKSSQLLSSYHHHPRTKPSLVQSVLTPYAKVIPSSKWLHDTTCKKFSGVRELEVDYYPNFFQGSNAYAILKELELELPPYLQKSKNEVKIMGRVHKIPRTQAAFGDEGLSYHFSGVTVPANTWIPVLGQIRDCLVDHLGEEFNFVLVNRYKDGYDHIGEHRDDERDLVNKASIACVSFGQERDFVLKHKDFRGKNGKKSKAIPERKSNLEVPLKHGSLLVMKHPTNRDWYHSIPIRKSATIARISLTFRVMKRS